MTTIGETFRYIDRLYRDARRAVHDAMDEARIRTGLPFAPTESFRYVEKLAYDWKDSELNLVPWGGFTWRAGDVEIVMVLRFYSRRYVFEPMLVVAHPDRPNEPLKSSGWYFEDLQRHGRTTATEDPTGLTVVDVRDHLGKTHARWRAFAVSLDRLTSPAVSCLSRNVTVRNPCYAHGRRPVNVETHPS